ncbi:hypothetical protein ACTJJ7_19935 [Phyllobacterium sp. 22229]|uniref:hypothetical protein n=1 Tax=Phyllobacterium sp. 22229 TaxID=3453895 RepID=UPI003F84808F
MGENYNTLGYHLQAGDMISAVCYNRECQHGAPLDLKYLVEKLGPEFLAMHHTLTPLLYCSECKSKNVGIRLNVNVEQKVSPTG